MSFGGEDGWSKTELVMVFTIIAVLLAFASAPKLEGSTGTGSSAVAAHNLALALPAVDAFYNANGSYYGLDDPVSGMKHYDPSLSPEVTVNNPIDLTDDTYCLKSVDGDRTAYVRGPDGTITTHKPFGCA
jgi:hypothetical protein